MKYNPRPYQEKGEAFIFKRFKVAGFVDMGLGKTVMTLSAISKLHAGLMIRGVLVVAPIMVMEETWPDEIKLWDHTRWMKHAIVRGSPISRKITRKGKIIKTKPNQKAIEALAQPVQIHLTNYENFPAICEWMKKQKALPWDMIVFDESSKMKSHSAQRFKKFKHQVGRFKRKVLLTGTPRPNSYLDLWSQIFCLDQGKRLGEFYTWFEDRFFEKNLYTYETKIRPGAAKQIRGLIKDLVFCLRSEDYLKLPPMVINTVKVKLPPKAMKLYKTFEKDMYVKIKEQDVEALSAAVLSMRCRQLTSGAVYNSPIDGAVSRVVGPKKWTAVHDAKLVALEDIIDEAAGEPILIVYEFKHELERLRKRWPKVPYIGGGCDRRVAKKNIRNWNAGKYKMMFVHPASVGHGVNLQHGGRFMVWTSMTWSYELFKQMIKRLHRSGQTKPVMVHLLIATDTVDEVVYEVLQKKKKGQNSLMKALRQKVLAS